MQIKVQNGQNPKHFLQHPLWVGASCILFFLSGLIVGKYYLDSLKTTNSEPYILLVRSGDSTYDISLRLQKEQVFSHARVFYLTLRGLRIQPKVGEYAIPPASSFYQLLDIFKNHKPVAHLFTVVEGSTPQKIAIDINRVWRLKGPLLDQIHVVLAESYDYVFGTSRKILYDRMHMALEKEAAVLWGESSAKDILPSVEALIILASLIEKETALDAERPKIAGVLRNRLRKGMRLQVDASVSYGLHLAQDRPLNQALTKAELQLDTAFNTYMYAGLPPKPICNPGKASLKAAANPMDTDALYYVADGTGGHVFTHSAQQHQKNHQKWRKVRKQKQQQTQK